MGLFDKIKKAFEDDRTYTQASDFKGTKKMIMVVNYKMFTDNIRKLSEPNPLYSITKDNNLGIDEKKLQGEKIFEYVLNMDEKKITFKGVELDFGKVINVCVDGKPVGSIDLKKTRTAKKLLTADIDKVYLDISGGNYKMINNAGSGEYLFDCFNNNHYTAALYVSFAE